MARRLEEADLSAFELAGTLLMLAAGETTVDVFGGLNVRVSAVA